MRSTIDNPTHAQPVLLSRDSLRCRPRYAATRFHPSPNGRKTQLARRPPRCDLTGGLPAWPSLPSAIATVAVVGSSAAEARGRGWRGWHRPPVHSDLAVRRDAATALWRALWAPEPDTSGRCLWSQDTDPSRRR